MWRVKVWRETGWCYISCTLAEKCSSQHSTSQCEAQHWPFAIAPSNVKLNIGPLLPNCHRLALPTIPLSPALRCPHVHIPTNSHAHINFLTISLVTNPKMLLCSYFTLCFKRVFGVILIQFDKYWIWESETSSLCNSRKNKTQKLKDICKCI